MRTNGPSSLKQYCLPGGASRVAALLLPQIRPVFSVVAPCHPGAALRNPVLLQRRRATRRHLACLRLERVHLHHARNNDARSQAQTSFAEQKETIAAAGLLRALSDEFHL